MEKDKYLLPSGFESLDVHASGVIISIDSPEAFHWNSTQSLDEWLLAHNVPGIISLDTRHLVHQIRDSQNILGKIIPDAPTGVRQYPSLDLPNGGDDFFDSSEHEILEQVSTKQGVVVGKGEKRVAVIDCGSNGT